MRPIDYFRAKITSQVDPIAATRSAQVLVGLLVRHERYREAVQISMEHPDRDPSQATRLSHFVSALPTRRGLRTAEGVSARTRRLTKFRGRCNSELTVTWNLSDGHRVTGYMRGGDFISGWGKILRGKLPLLSIEITSECPLSCPGCYAYGDRHLGGGVTLTQLSDSRGETLVQGILRLVDQHDPMQLSLVGGEPMMRHRELSQLLPILSARGIYTMVVTSGVIPIPAEWTSLPRITIAISVDGLPEHHDERRKPATYERILRNIGGAKRCISTGMAVRASTFRSSQLRPTLFLEFWSARPEVHRIWMSVYTPQRGEQSAERLTLERP